MNDRDIPDIIKSSLSSAEAHKRLRRLEWTIILITMVTSGAILVAMQLR